MFLTGSLPVDMRCDDGITPDIWPYHVTGSYRTLAGYDENPSPFGHLGGDRSCHLEFCRWECYERWTSHVPYGES